MRKLLLILLLTFSLSADYITPIFYQLGADDSQIGHFMVGKTLSDFCEETLEWDWLGSGLTVAGAAVLKECLDEFQHAGSFNWQDAEWTMYGWVFRRFLTWEWEF